MELPSQPRQYSQYSQYNPAPARPPGREKRGINWPAILIALSVLIVILGLAVWRIGRNDAEEDASIGADRASTAVSDADSLQADTPDDGGSPAGSSPDGGDNEQLERSEQPAGSDGGGTSASSADPPPASTPPAESVPFSTTTFTIPEQLPADADRFGPTALSERSTVSTVGLDEVTFGMSVQDAQKAAGTLMIPVTPIGSCYHVIPYDAPEGILFLVHNGTIERVDINSGPITTRSGVGIGTPDETVANLFGDAIERSARPDGTVDLIFVPRDAGDSNFRVIFNIADGEVRAYKSGRIPQVLSATGCEIPENG